MQYHKIRQPFQKGKEIGVGVSFRYEQSYVKLILCLIILRDVTQYQCDSMQLNSTQSDSMWHNLTQ